MKQAKIPRHIAIIPDGNRRWAKKRGLHSWIGHRQGAKSIDDIIRTALDLKIQNLTFWICSKDNLEKRAKKEVGFLLSLFKKEFSRMLKSDDIHKNQVKVRFLGDWERYFSNSLKKILNQLMEDTKHYKRHNLTFLAGYDGKEDMIKAVKEIVSRETQLKNRKKIDYSLIKNHLWTKDLPPVDIVIRTGGEPHLSAGFMMWDIADAQLYFTDKLWPDFGKNDLIKAINDCSRRKRRLGA